MPKKCRYCMEVMDGDATKCAACGSWQSAFKMAFSSYYSKFGISIGLIFLAGFITAEFMGPSELEQMMETKLEKGQLDSIKVTGLDFRIDNNDCYEKKIVGHLKISNQLSKPLDNVSVQITLLKGDSIKYAFSEYVSGDVFPNSGLTQTIDEKLSLSDKVEFDSVDLKVLNAAFTF